MYFIGFDIGGSKIKAVLVRDKKIVKSRLADLSDNPEALLELVLKIFNDLVISIKKDDIGGVGFSLAGALDIKRERMLKSPNIPYLDGQPIKRLLERKLGRRQIKVEHDVNCFLLAEAEVGWAKNLKNVFYLTVGTGVGGALMIDGKIYFGAHGAAGEVGHMIIEASQQLDLEDLTANKFVKRKLGVSAAEAEKMARAGEEKARKIFIERGKNLGAGLASVINIFDPEAIILSGGASSAKDLLLPGIKEGIERYVISSAAKKTKILFSRLGREGGALGAALLFSHK